MDNLQFVVPVRIVAEPGQPVTEIYSVEQALTFLQNWPAGRQGPVFQAALNACFGTTVEQSTTESARKSFTAFARLSGILAKDSPEAVIVSLDGEVRPLPR